MLRSHVFICSFLFAAFASAATGKIPTGRYGGQAIHVNVTDNLISINFPCAYGEFPNPAVKADGTFSASGWTETALYMRNKPKVPTTLVGTLSGKRMRLMLSDGNTRARLETYEVTLGENTPFAICN